MLCLRCVAVLALLISVACGSAFAASVAGPVAMDAAVERAKFIVHLKVVGLEESTTVAEKFDDGKVIYEDDWAVCEVKKIVLGMIATDKDGRIRITSASTKSTVNYGGATRYKTGDEITVVCQSSTLDRKVGMILPGNHLHMQGKPSDELLRLLDGRISRAEQTRDALAKLLPGAQKEVEKALKEFDDAKRDDFKDLSPEADLLFDFCAAAQYTPDLSDMPRPALSDSDRKRLTLLALRGVGELSAEDAASASALVEGKGNGAYQLLKPVDSSKALDALRGLGTKKQLDNVLGFLCRHDVPGPDMPVAARWAAELASGGDATAQVAEWSLIEACEEGFLDRGLMRELFAGKDSDESLQARCITRAIDKRAERLAAYFVLCGSTGDSAKAQALLTKDLQDATRKEVAALMSRTEMLQIYTYALGMRGVDDACVKSVRGQVDGKIHGHGELDFTDVADLARELRARDKLTNAIRRVLKRHTPERR
jgi:hypothetical protein